MGDFFRDLSTQMKGIWARLDGGQRMTIGAVLLGVLVALGGMVWYAGQPEMREIHRVQSGEELAEAVQALSQSNIEYVVDGMGILVDATDVGMANSALLQNGVKGRDGSSTTGDISAMTADRKMRDWFLTEKKLKALRQNLEMLDGVRAADAKYSPAKTALSQRDRELSMPMATVILDLRAGHDLHKWGPAAAQLASAAVGVPMRYVTVVDQHGRSWTHDPERGSGGNDFFDLQDQMTRKLTTRAQDYLDRIFPPVPDEEGVLPNIALVDVQVQLDASYEIRQEEILPESPVLIEETSSEEKNLRTPGSPGGDTATAGEAEDRGSRRTAGTDDRTNKQETAKYMPTVGSKRSGKLAPTIQTMSCAVTLPTSIEADSRLAGQIESAIKSIIGWDTGFETGAGFSIVYRDVKALQPPAEMSPGITDSLEGYLPLVTQLLGVGLVLFFLTGLLKGKGAGSAGKGAKGKGAKSASVTASASTDRGQSEEVDPLDPSVDPADAAKRMRKEIEKAISDDPAAISRMVERWISEVRV